MQKLSKAQITALRKIKKGMHEGISSATIVSLFKRGLIRPASINGEIPFPHDAQAWEIVQDDT